MKPHIKIYLNYFGYGEQDFIPCTNPECSCKAVSIHHIDKRGMGGSRNKDYIENLAALCMECHTKADNNKEFNEMIRYNHLRKINNARCMVSADDRKLDYTQC